MTRLALDQQLKLQYDSVIAAVDYEGRAALAVSAVIAALPPVGDAIAKGDRDALAALLGASMKALTAQGIPLITFQTPPALVLYRVHAPKVFGDDISARRNTVVEALKTGKPIVGVEPGREALGIFGMTPILRDGKSHWRSPTSAPPSARNSSIAPSSASASTLPCIRSTARIQETVLDLRRHRGRHAGGIERRARTARRCERDASSTAIPPRFMSGRSENYAGEPVAVLEVIKDTTEYEAAAASSQRNLIFGAVAILAVAALLAFLLGRGMSRPLRRSPP